MAKSPPNLDDFEMDLFKRGYKPVTETELQDVPEHFNPRRIFIDIKPIYNDVRFLGFQEEILIRIKLRDNKYFATTYIKKE